MKMKTQLTGTIETLQNSAKRKVYGHECLH
jgi:hypothetical protein